MLAAERRKLILEQLQLEKKVIVNRLSGFFNVSDETIRRDLDKLCADGYAVKSYGGATLHENGIDLPFYIRKTHNPTEKKKIAEIIASLVNDGECIILDASTTSVFAAKALKNKRNLTVITNSMEVMIELADRHDWRVFSTGGILHGDSLSFLGQRTADEFKSFYADKLIFSCKGLDAGRGIFDNNDEFSQVKQAMIKTAKVKILAVDYSKFDRDAFSKIADIGDMDIIVTDRKPNERWMDYMKNHNAELVY
jgi:DeoR/GlpR family transcriptional regulator of sugar metabolism